MIDEEEFIWNAGDWRSTPKAQIIWFLFKNKELDKPQFIEYETGRFRTHGFMASESRLNYFGHGKYFRTSLSDEIFWALGVDPLIENKTD